MNTFKRKALLTAVAAGLGAAGTAEAVYLSPNNMGQVLVYPYYTTQTASGNGWNTYITVVNTTARAKALKVRVLEGKTSSEVLDFNLFLSANDMWTAAIIPIDASSATAGARIITADVSCTNPGFTTADFRNYQYATGDAALPGTLLDRTREGYVEILEMGTLTGTWAAAVTHNSAGTPANCAVVQRSETAAVLTPLGLSIEAPAGGLAGTGTLINVNNGQDAGYKADALDAWSTVTQYSPPTAVTPNLGSATPEQSTVLNVGTLDAAGGSSLATIYRVDWALTSGVTGGIRAVASVYMHSAVINEYILDNATLSNTDWVVTQPLKNLFVNATTAAQPYSNVLTSGGACETISFSFFNREERGATAAGTDFSPTPPAGNPNTLCWEVNVLSIRNPAAAHMPTSASISGVLGSINTTSVNVTSGFQNGWGNLTFTGVNAATNGMSGAGATTSRTAVGSAVVATIAAGTAGSVTFFGLPVTGFMVRTFRNNNPLTCGTSLCANSYGSLFNHSYRTTITP